MKIDIDKYAGFCFGVTKAINIAEENSLKDGKIYSLGQILHNEQEEKRLKKIGVTTIDHSKISEIKTQKMLIRAHGEPPETYTKAIKNNVEIVDATCPVVLKLQKQIKEKFEKYPDVQIVIYGKRGHAEVNGLVGQTNGKAIVISSINEIEKIDLSKKIFLFSQTTSNHNEYLKIENILNKKYLEKYGNTDKIEIYQTICPSVKNRIPRLKEFCTNHELILFVSDYKSSNGKMLFQECLKNNKNSYFITETKDLKQEWFLNCKSIGISGATSTPFWLMENIKSKIITDYIQS